MKLKKEVDNHLSKGYGAVLYIVVSGIDNYNYVVTSKITPKASFKSLEYNMSNASVETSAENNGVNYVFIYGEIEGVWDVI